MRMMARAKLWWSSGWVRHSTVGRPRAFRWHTKEDSWITPYRPHGWPLGMRWNAVPGCVHVSLGWWEIGVWVGLGSYWHEDYRILSPRWTLGWTWSMWGLFWLWVEPDTRPGSRRVDLQVGPCVLEYRLRAPEGEARPVEDR